MVKMAPGATLILLLLVCLPLAAENSITVELTSLAGLVRGEDAVPDATAASRAEVTFRSTGNSNVKAQLTMEADVADTALIDVSRAFIKARFPAFRLTLGKTRLSWGEGFMFNAGDVIFDSLSTSADLTADEIRTRGTWLASAYIPLGRFSFAEAVLLPPAFDPLTYLIDSRIAAEAGEDPPEIPRGYRSSGGMRLVLRPGGIKTEAGYLYSGESESHKPYVSFQGNLIADWHLSASTSMGIYNGGDDAAENLAVSFGLFHPVKTGSSGSLGLRLEGVIHPQAGWEASADQYGIYLYPEISYSPDDRQSVFYRGIVSPVDISAVHVFGGTWNIYQGFDLLMYAGAATGDPEYFVTAGCSFAF